MNDSPIGGPVACVCVCVYGMYNESVSTGVHGYTCQFPSINKTCN